MRPPTLREAPTLETQRLVLRAHRVSDYDDGFALWADPEVVRYIGGRTATPEDAWARLLRYAGHWSLLGYGFWAAVEKATGRYIGDVGLGDFHRAFDPPAASFEDGVPEAGWAFAVDAHGKGYATEAMTAGLAWSDAHLAPVATVCIVHPDNTGSLSVARKCGFVPAETIDFRGEPTAILRRPRPAG
jgi:RimJ/RimL family protein N-acetyltransferase